MSFFRSKPVLWLTGYLARVLLSLLYATLRVEIIGREHVRTKQIIALWHDRLLLVPLLRRVSTVPLAVVVSNSRDGKLLGALVDTFKNADTIYVAHNKRHAALSAMERAHADGKTIIITPDGPRGPRHMLKPGLSFIQKQTDAQIISFTWTSSSSWILNTWDKMEIPKPFSKVIIRFDNNFPHML